MVAEWGDQWTPAMRNVAQAETDNFAELIKSADWNERWAPAMRDVAQAETENFVELIQIAGLDPAKHLRFGDWCGVSFAGCDLRGFDFTGARFHHCDFTGALIEGAQIDQAEIDRAELDPKRRSNLRAAKDWAAHVAAWRKPAALLPDAHLPAGAVFRDAPFAPKLVVTPPGEFMMGSPPDEPGRYDDEGPQHPVTISRGFAMARYAVTFEQWDFAQADKDWQRITGIEARKPADRGWGRGNRPVIDVSWEDAQAYAKWLSAKTGRDYRLPSEAEWEYAARAGTTTPFWWGASITPDQANYDGKRVYEGGGGKGENREMTVPVNQFEPNPFGLYQVHGNVYEWVEDCWKEDYEGAPEDGSPWTTGDGSLRVLRGGSWLDIPQLLRAASRYGSNPVDRGYIVGFRLSRTLIP